MRIEMYWLQSAGFISANRNVLLQSAEFISAIPEIPGLLDQIFLLFAIEEHVKNFGELNLRFAKKKKGDVLLRRKAGQRVSSKSGYRGASFYHIV